MVGGITMGVNKVLCFGKNGGVAHHHSLAATGGARSEQDVCHAFGWGKRRIMVGYDV